MVQSNANKSDSWWQTESESALIKNATSNQSSADSLAQKILSEQRSLIPKNDVWPKVETYFQYFPAVSKNGELAIDIIYNEFLVRSEKAMLSGETPPEPAEYLQRFPQYASALHAQIQLFNALDSDGLSPVAQLGDLKDETLNQTLEASVLADRYELQKKLGDGGFAVVYRAWDRRLKRAVAIKLTRFALTPSSKHFQRFEREAESVARLSHPGILQIYEFGEEDGRPFIVGQLAEGGTLDQRISSSMPDSETSVRWLIELCEAVEYAHQFGVIHRDIKPANILFHEGSVCLADFGLASLAESDQGITMQGDLLGTPAYMSPEQIRGGEAATPASDIYSLGVVMYQLLCGKLPFEGPTSLVLRQTLTDEPVALRSINKLVPKDLQTICQKAMTKAAGNRYLSVREMADDLRSYLNHEPIRARPVGPIGKLTRWCQRQPALATTIVCAAILITAICAASFNSISNERDRFRTERDRANAELFESLVNNAESNLASKTTGWYRRTKQFLVLAAALELPDRDTGRLRELMIKLLVDDSLRFEASDSFMLPDSSAAAIGVDPDQRFVVVANQRGQLHLRSYDLTRQLAILKLPTNEAASGPVTDIQVLLNPLAVICQVANEICVWDLDANAPIGTDTQINGRVVASEIESYAVSNNQQTIALAESGRISLLSLDQFMSGIEADIVSFDTGLSKVGCMCFSTDDQQIYLGIGATLQCRSTANGSLVDSIKNPREPIRHLSAGQDGAFWTDSTSYSTCFWKPGDKAFARSNRLSGSVVELGIKQTQAICATRDGAILLFDFSGPNPKIIAQAIGSSTGLGEIECMVSQSGQSGKGDGLFAGYSNGRLQKWQLANSEVAKGWSSYQSLAINKEGILFGPGHGYQISDITSQRVNHAIPAFQNLVMDTETGDLFASRNNHLVSWRASDGQLTEKYDAHSSPILIVSVDSARKQLLTLDETGTLQLRTIANLELVGEQKTDGSVQQLISRDGQIVTSGQNGVQAFAAFDQMGRSNNSAATLISELPNQSIVAHGNRLIVYGQSTEATVFEFGSSRKLGLLKGHAANIRYARVVPGTGSDQSRLATIGGDQTLRVWDLDTLEQIRQLKIPRSIDRCSIDPLGKYAILFDSHSRLEKLLFDFETGHQLAIFASTGELGEEVFFSPDGKRVFIRGPGILQVERSRLEQAFRVQAAQIETVPVEIPNEFNYAIPGAPQLSQWSVDVSNDGKWIATAGQDRSVRIQDAENFRLTHFLTEHDDVVWSCAFSNDSQWLATGSVRENRGEVIVWNTNTWKVATRFYLGTDLIASLQFHPKLPLLVASCYDGGAWLLDHQTGKTLQQILPNEPSGPAAMDVEFTKDGKFLAIAQTSNGVSIWKLHDAPEDEAHETTCSVDLYQTVEDHGQRIWTTEFSNDQEVLVTATQSGLIRLYAFPSLEPIVTIDSSSDGFRQIGFGPNDEYMALSAWSSRPGIVLHLKKLRESLAEFGLNW